MNLFVFAGAVVKSNLYSEIRYTNTITVFNLCLMDFLAIEISFVSRFQVFDIPFSVTVDIDYGVLLRD